MDDRVTTDRPLCYLAEDTCSVEEAQTMPSPFPGMDPFLEEPTEWAGVHSRLINAISDDLADRLAPHFIVKIEERVYITASDDPLKQAIVPDIYVISGRSSGRSPETVSVITPPTLVEPLYELEVRDRYLEVHDARTREVIVTLEILSPFNKSPGTQGRAAFVRKRQAVMSSTTHWIEIDLLRAGERSQEAVGNSDYYALLKRGQRDVPFEVWHIDLRDRLPTIAVPLRSPLADVPLDLQAAFDRVYARGHYAESVDYTGRIPPPPLRPADAVWAAGRVRDWLAAREP